MKLSSNQKRKIAGSTRRGVADILNGRAEIDRSAPKALLAVVDKLLSSLSRKRRAYLAKHVTDILQPAVVDKAIDLAMKPGLASNFRDVKDKTTVSVAAALGDKAFIDLDGDNIAQGLAEKLGEARILDLSPRRSGRVRRLSRKKRGV